MSIYVSGPADRPIVVSIYAEPGDAPLPVVPANPADCTAGAPTTAAGAAGGTGGGQGGGQSGGSGLANTGVDAVSLAALALVCGPGAFRFATVTQSGIHPLGMRLE